MLGTLHKKFVAIIMACVSLVLIAAFGAICLLTYSQDLAGVSSLMRDRLEHAANTQAPPPAGVGAPTGKGAPEPPSIGGGQSTRAQLTPIVVYEVDSAGSIAALSDYSTALVPSEFLDQAVSEALAEKEDFGHLPSNELLFCKRSQGGATYVAFADEASIDGWKTLALTLFGVGTLVLAGFWFISIRFSHWALAPIERTWAQQRQFVADASHELKTPLTVILANTAILKSHPEASIQSQAQWIESTQAEAKRMQGLVNDMLELARIDGERNAPGDFEAIDLSDMIKGQVLQFESVAFERSITIAENITRKVFVKGERERVQRLIRTLLDNACKYSDKGSVVKVSLDARAGQAILSVSNKGAVIKSADLDRVFDRFYRADKARARETGGHGLGLAIARDIAREHGGDIVASSDPQGLTSFTLTLPLIAGSSPKD